MFYICKLISEETICLQNMCDRARYLYSGKCMNIRRSTQDRMLQQAHLLIPISPRSLVPGDGVVSSIYWASLYTVALVGASHQDPASCWYCSLFSGLHSNQSNKTRVDILNFVEAFSGLTGMTEGQLLDWVRSGSGIINIGIIQYNEIHKWLFRVKNISTLNFHFYDM